MHTTTIHIKTDIKIRDDAKKVAEEFGFSLTSLVNAMLRQIASTKRLSLSLEENPTPYKIEAMKQAQEDVKAGRVISFQSGTEVLSYIDSLIKDETKKQHHKS